MFSNVLSIQAKLFAIFIGVLLSACQSAPNVYVPEREFQGEKLFADHLFPSYVGQRIETTEEIFELTPDMVKKAKKYVKRFDSVEDQVSALIKLIFSEQQIGLTYQNFANLTAKETFTSGKANCISLTILAYSLARKLNLNVYFQDVKVPEYWVRDGRYSMLAGHVNLLVSQETLVHNDYVYTPYKMVVDFDPYIRQKHFPSRMIPKERIVAMFYINKAAQSMVVKDYELAYAYLKSALIMSPDFSSAWGNLGVLYRLVGEQELAYQAYEHAINLDGENYTAITNLAILLNLQGKTEQALAIQSRLHNMRIKNPFYHAMIANNAYFDGKYDKAINSFKKAIRIDDNQHEFYYGLAKAYVAINENVAAEQALRRAIKHNKYRASRVEYIAKLNYLRRH